MQLKASAGVSDASCTEPEPAASASREKNASITTELEVSGVTDITRTMPALYPLHCSRNT